MGNKKNKNNKRKNNHRHVFKRRKPTGEKTEAKQDAEKQRHDTIDLAGSRIINLHKLNQYTINLDEHSNYCKGSIILTGETRNGLASILTGSCSMCQHTIKLETSEKVKGPQGYNR